MVDAKVFTAKMGFTTQTLDRKQVVDIAACHRTMLTNVEIHSLPAKDAD